MGRIVLLGVSAAATLGVFSDCGVVLAKAGIVLKRGGQEASLWFVVVVEMSRVCVRTSVIG